MKSKFAYFITAVFVYYLSGCAVETSDIRSGIFVDSAVEGLMYKSGSVTGRTDGSGRFYYQEGNKVTFSIEGVVIGEAAVGKPLMTPIDLVPDNDSFVTHSTVTNICRFLQSLDDDGDPDNGIRISSDMRKKVADTFTSIDFKEENFENEVSGFFTEGQKLLSAADAQAHFFSTVAAHKILPVDLINLGDGFTAGVQSTKAGIPDVSELENVNIHENTQSGSFAAFLAGRMKSVAFFSMEKDKTFEWNNPLLTLKNENTREKERKKENDEYLIPYNLALPGATVTGLVENNIKPDNKLLYELARPIPEKKGADSLSQLDAAKWVASQAGHEGRMKLFTLWIGINDVLGALTDGGGTKLTTGDIRSFLDAHDTTALENSLKATVDDLKAIRYSYLFIANLPDVTRLAGVFYKEDIESMATFGEPAVTALADYETAGDDDVVAIGFKAFAGDDTTNGGISRFLDSDNETLNTELNKIADNESLTKKEIDLIRARADTINDIINSLDDGLRVFVVDCRGLFDGLSSQVEEKKVKVGSDVLTRSFGGGFFDLGGIYPSNTGHALIAKKFIEKINKPFSDRDDGIGLNFDETSAGKSIEDIWLTEPYRDKDKDGFPAGPGWTLDINEFLIIDPALRRLADCNDGSSSTLPHAVDETSCSG